MSLDLAGGSGGGDGTVIEMSWVPTIDENGVMTWVHTTGTPAAFDLKEVGVFVVCSPTPPAEPFNGLIWIQSPDVTAAPTSDTISTLTVVESSTTPATASDGSIWIKTE